MTTLAVQHKVADFEAWKPVFDEHGAVRKEHGCTSETVLRAADDADNVLVLMRFPTAADAHGFMADPSLPEAMGRGGVVGTPRIELYEEASS
jgi:imidazolonepropionase-like amidohydrolase